MLAYRYWLLKKNFRAKGFSCAATLRVRIVACSQLLQERLTVPGSVLLSCRHKLAARHEHTVLERASLVRLRRGYHIFGPVAVHSLRGATLGV